MTQIAKAWKDNNLQPSTEDDNESNKITWRLGTSFEARQTTVKELRSYDSDEIVEERNKRQLGHKHHRLHDKHHGTNYDNCLDDKMITTITTIQKPRTSEINKMYQLIKITNTMTKSTALFLRDKCTQLSHDIHEIGCTHKLNLVDLSNHTDLVCCKTIH